MLSLQNLAIYYLTIMSLISASLSFGAFVFFINKGDVPIYGILLALALTIGHAVISYGLLGVSIEELFGESK